MFVSCIIPQGRAAAEAVAKMDNRRRLINGFYQLFVSCLHNRPPSVFAVQQYYYLLYPIKYAASIGLGHVNYIVHFLWLFMDY